MTVEPSDRDLRPLRGTQLAEVVTGEAVRLDIPPASLPQRLGSGLIDAVISVIGLIASLFLLFYLSADLSEPVLASLSLLTTIAWLVGLPALIETLTRGRSVGKFVTRTRTVRDDGGPIVFRHALSRALVGFVEIYALSGLPALLTAMSTERSRRLGDLTAGTYVVREVTRLNLTRPVEMPFALAGWAQRADIAPLPDGTALAIRQFLERRRSFSSAARAEIGQDLLRQVLPLVAPQPPRGSSVEDILAAVAARRRQDDTRRLQAAAQVRARLLPPQRW